MNSVTEIAEIELMDKQVVVIFEPETAAVLTHQDLHDLAVSKNAFVKTEEME